MASRIGSTRTETTVSFNRLTMSPCKDCCRPKTYEVSTATWGGLYSTQKLYNITATSGICSSSVSLTTENTIEVQTACTPGNQTSCFIGGLDLSGTFDEQAGGSETTCITPDYRPDCYPDCPDEPCTGMDHINVNGGGDFHTACLDYSINSGCCSDTGSNDCAQVLAWWIKNGYHDIQETEYYDSGMSLIGQPDQFVGYPTQVDGCHAHRKGLRNIYAKKHSANNYIELKWLVVKEWDDGSENTLFVKDMFVLQNELGNYATSINLNNDAGISCLGSTQPTKLFQRIRLGDGEGDGSFGEGSGWYDITDNAVMFQYMKPNTSATLTDIVMHYACGCLGTYCSTCGYPSNCTTTWRSPYAQIEFSTDVEDEDGNCIWDAGAGGGNFGGSWTALYTDAYWDSGTCTVS